MDTATTQTLVAVALYVCYTVAALALLDDFFVLVAVAVVGALLVPAAVRSVAL